jgi:hypothetical protein
MKKISFFIVALVVSMATCSQSSGGRAVSAGGVPFEVKRSVFFADGSLDEYVSSQWDSNYTHLDSEVRYSASGAMIEQIEFAYSEDAKVTSKITRDMESRLKNRVVYQYNQRGERWRENLVDNKGRVVSTYEYTYDGKGNLTNRIIKNRAGDKLAETMYIYDSLSRMIASETKDSAEIAISSTKYSYDSQGKVLKEEVVNGEGRLTSITSYVWQDGKEARNEMAAPDGKILLRVSNDYGNNGELTRRVIDNLQGESKQILQYEYTYRPARR